ncbi:MAG: (Fe-S)-binding protein [Gammaproteobacteria bacterium]|nr:MAG: (Fe-S)-binding protein [Gammaproteobacteria bacterium]
MSDTTTATNDSGARPRGRVALFVTCLVDLYRPEIGFAAVQLLERAGFVVEVPRQGCCGQPNFNSGDRAGAGKIASRVIDRFAPFDYVVAPSGSCAAMLRVHYPGLFSAGSEARRAAARLAEKTFELTSFLYDIAGLREVAAELDGVVTYHDGCSGLRELGVARQPRELLKSISGIELREMNQPDACCGFGGLFCMKYPEISERITGSKVRDILATDADYLVAGDLGCLLQMAGTLERNGHAVKAVHVAEVLAGMIGPDRSADH